MTKALKCPCYRKSFKRIQQHLAYRPKCALFLKQNIAHLDSKNAYNFTNDVIPTTVTTVSPVTPVNFGVSNEAGDDIDDEEINFDFYTDNLNSSFQTVDDDDNLVYTNGINHQHLISNRNLRSGCSTKDFSVQLQLLQLVEAIGAPLQTYDKIMNWATTAYNSGYKFPCHYPNRNNMINKISEVFCMRKMAPVYETITLHDGNKCNVSHFDFEQMCYSLLSDKSLMKDSNFSLGNNHPKQFQKVNVDIMSCIEDGQMFQNTIGEVCVNEEDFLLGIKMFIDATHTDVHGDWVLDPVNFTFTFFNNQITREKRAWRTLGFINNLNKKSKAWNNHITAQNKMIDYHSQLSIILKSLSECQKRDGFLWDFKYKNIIHRLRMKPVLLLVIGDAQGNHKLAGMYNNFSNTFRANHSCDCPLHKTDDPDFSCQFVKQSDIDFLCDTGDLATLNKLSHHRIRNAFRDVKLGRHDAGINAMMPSEILHQLFLGVMEYVLDSFLLTYPPKARTRMDKYGSFMYTCFKRVSDRTMPRMKTKNGFTNLTRLKGSDRLGLCLLLLIMMVSQYQEHLMSGIRYAPSVTNRRNYTIIFQKLLCLAQWLSKDDVHINELDGIHTKIKGLMTLIKSTCYREKQTGWKVSKFHEMLHVTRDISLFGPAQGYDGRPGESSHKDTKQQARRTQRRSNVFELQTSQRIYESLVIRRGCTHIIQTQEAKYGGTEEGIFDCNEVSSKSNYYIVQDSDRRVVMSNAKGSKIFNKDIVHISPKHQQIFNRIFNQFSHLFSDGRIPCKTSILSKNKDLFRATESFYNSTSWNDWAWVQWDYGDLNIVEVPAIIFCFLDLRQADIKMLDDRGLHRSIYAFICSAKNVPNQTHLNSITIVKKLMLEEENDGLRFRLVSIESFTKPCCAVPNISSWNKDEHKQIPRDWLFVEPRTTWESHF